MSYPLSPLMLVVLSYPSLCSLPLFPSPPSRSLVLSCLVLKSHLSLVVLALFCVCLSCLLVSHVPPSPHTHGPSLPTRQHFPVVPPRQLLQQLSPSPPSPPTLPLCPSRRSPYVPLMVLASPDQPEPGFYISRSPPSLMMSFGHAVEPDTHTLTAPTSPQGGSCVYLPDAVM